MWLACHTQKEIADSVGLSEGAINEWTDDFLTLSQDDNLRKSSDFEVPIYNVWKQQNKSNKVDHFGNSEPRWLENLLYLYTNQ